MLRWIARRLKDAQVEEKGFTLIELLVVIIIIGILAAIALPTFLNQREQAWEAAAQSDLRNAAAAATSCSADEPNDGSYADCGAVDAAGVLTFGGGDNYGFHQTEDVVFDAATLVTEDTRWAADASNVNGGSSFYYDTGNGSRVTEGVHPADPAP